MPKQGKEPAVPRARGPYAKGAERRALLLDTAERLLRVQELDDLSLKDIAEAADVPVSSAYHFFANVHEVYVALAQRFQVALYERLSAPYGNAEARSWQELFDAAVDRAVHLYEAQPAYRQLIIGAKAPPEIKLADRAHDERVGQLVIDVFRRHFALQETEGLKDSFFYATEIVDLMFSLSVIREGAITPLMAKEAKKAGRAYLSLYLPEQLPAR